MKNSKDWRTESAILETTPLPRYWNPANNERRCSMLAIRTRPQWTSHRPGSGSGNQVPCRYMLPIGIAFFGFCMLLCGALAN